MRILPTAFFLLLTLASTPAEEILACPRDTPDISALIAKAESGNPEAQLELGQTFSERKTLEGLTQAVYWFRKAAEQGYADAEMRLAGAYGAGEGVSRDNNFALYWLMKAAEDGQATAQWVLGALYRDGREVERNEEKAFDLFLRAAKQGDVDSQFSVAQMYEEGDVVPQNYVRAVNWYKKASEHVPDRGGAGQARNNLGFLYSDGTGVPQDFVTAYMYFALANNKQNMWWVAEKMTSSQIAEAQRKAKEWTQQHPQLSTCMAPE
jgi:uncharacterized protein